MRNHRPKEEIGSLTCPSQLQLYLALLCCSFSWHFVLFTNQCQNFPVFLMWECESVSGCSVWNSFFLISNTWTSSCSASFHLPWLWYVLARFTISKRVSGCSASSSFFLMSNTWTSSCSAASHFPWLWYVLARFAIPESVSGCSYWIVQAIKSTFRYCVSLPFSIAILHFPFYSFPLLFPYYNFRRLRQSLTVVVSKVQSQMSLEECKFWTCFVLLGLRVKVQVERLSY